MRNNLLLFCLVLPFFLCSCTAIKPKNRQGAADRAEPGMVSEDSTERTAVETRHEYLERQEHELSQSLADVQGASVRLERRYLSITFRSDVLFDVNAAILKAAAFEEIRRVADILIKYPKTAVRIYGHTDSIGSERYNMQLSQRRATAVKEAMAGFGVAPDRVTARGFGESRPIVSNATEAGRQTNRRVIILIVPRR